MLLSLLLLALFRQLLPEVLPLLSAIVLLLDLIHDPEYGQEPRSCNITDILIELKHKAAIRDYLPSLLERLIKIGLLLQLYSAIVQRIRIKSSEPIFPPIFALVMHHIIVVTDGMDIDEGALADAAHPRAILQTHGMRFTPWALHQLFIISIKLS